MPPHAATSSDLKGLTPRFDLAISPAPIRVSDKNTAADGSITYRLDAAIGAVAGMVMHSGRLIPKSVQATAVEDVRNSGRQLTMLLGHPAADEYGQLTRERGGIFGPVEDIAAVVDADQVSFDEATGYTTLGTIRIVAGTPGERLVQLLDSGVDLGLSQRYMAAGHWVYLEESDVEVELMDSLFIVGYDFVHLANANAGDVTRVTSVSDSVVDALMAGEGRMPPDPKAVSDATAKVRRTHKIAESLRATCDAFRASTIARLGSAEGPLVAKVDEALDEIHAKSRAILDDETIDAEVAHARMEALAGKASAAFGELSKLAPVADSAPPPAPKPEEKPPAPKADAPKPVLDALDSLTTTLKGSMDAARLLDTALAEQKHLSDDERKLVRETVDLKGVTDSAGVEAALKRAVSLYDAGKARATLEAKGMRGAASGAKGNDVNHPATDVGMAPTDKAMLAFMDSLRSTGAFRAKERMASTDPAMRTNTDMIDPAKRLAVNPFLDTMLKRFDQWHTPAFSDGAWDIQRDAQVYLDASTAGTDLVLPRTILSRAVLAEVFAMNILAAVTRQVPMDEPLQQIPIKSFGRSSDYTGGAGYLRDYNPDVFQRSSLQVAELAAILDGQIRVTYQNISVVARKLATTMSVEFLSRARRHADLASVAMAIDGIVESYRRSFLQDVFYTQILATSLGRGATAFTFDNIAEGVQLADGTKTTFQIIGAPVTGTDPATAVSVVPDGTLVVQEGTDGGSETAVPEYKTSATGGGTGSAFWYTIDYANATVTFVNSSGVPTAPASGKSILVTAGNKASGETRFNMNPGAVDEDIYFNKLIHTIGKVKAANETGDNTAINGYDMDLLLTSNSVMEQMASAKAYAAEGARSNVMADGMGPEGNYGRVRRLSAWGSKVFPSSWAVVMAADAVIHGVYTPPELRGPTEAVDGSGNLIGGQKFYLFTEDALVTPLVSKIAPPVTLYTK